ncbi:MAG: ribonuclease H-like domain-containing protein [Leptospirales bacterium]|nr:ribonuclease H-like domain-containing protein [Leptospirales bacterium]
MSRLGALLSLYERRDAIQDERSTSAVEPPLGAQKRDSEELFDLSFERLGEGALLRRWRSDDPQAGRFRFSRYMPLSLSPLLELALWPGAQTVAADEIAFLDVESTGLSRGVGVVPFLIGLAMIDSSGVSVEQILMPSPSAEERCLEYLSSRLSSFEYLVTFNGKSFDAPLIRNRLLLHRRPQLPRLAHFDLLHVFRRLISREAMPGRRQADLERELLGLDRGDDLPGAEAPQIYFDWLNYGHDAGMARVLEHNRLDLVGMCFLMLEAIHIYERRDGGRRLLRSGLARTLLRNQHIEEAIVMLGSRLEEDRDAPLRRRDLILLAQLYRRLGRNSDAAQALWQAIRDHDCDVSRMMLMRLQEHRLHDYDGALALCLEMLVKASRTETVYGAEELGRRRLRLERKRQRQSA